MAERRMFAKAIVLSDAFLDMPMSARCLYFTLSMFADDDGFVGSPKAIMWQCGASQDDMVVLLQKRFILGFDSGVIVIKHWRMNNYLRNDRKHSTTYLEELSTLRLDDKDAYVEANKAVGIPSDNQLPTNCLPTAYQMETEVSIGKESIDKVSINTSVDSEPKKTDKFDLWWEHYPRKVGKEAARKAFAKVKVDTQILIDAVEKQKHSEQWTKENGRYIPNPATWLNQGRWEDELQTTRELKRTNYNSSPSDLERMKKIYEKVSATK